MVERILTVGGNAATRLLSEFQRKITGNEFYVSSVNGSVNHGGRSAAGAAASIAQCLDYMTADNDDVMYLMPGHAETISEAAGLALDVAGVTIIGIGSGSLQPSITFDTIISADLDVDAANVAIENVNFVAGFADITAAIDVNAVGFTLRKCRFTQAAVDKNALIWIQDGALLTSNNITIEECYCLAPDASNTHFINLAGTGDGHIIRNNILIGDWGTMAIGGAGIVTNILIADNLINNKAVTVDGCINLAATATGIVVRNLCAGGAAAANGITATACLIAENYYNLITADLSGILDPATA